MPIGTPPPPVYSKCSALELERVRKELKVKKELDAFFLQQGLKQRWDNNMAEVKERANALDVQVGGGHYKDLAIQPVEYCMKNNLNYCQANIVKYATRYKDKSGVEDLKKIKHYVDLLIELEYGEGNEESVNNK